MFSALIFDMDGLLIDSERAIMQAWLAVAAEMDVTMRPEDYVQIIGRAAPEAFAILGTLVGGGPERLADARARVNARLRGGRDEPPTFALKSGAQGVLEAARQRGIPCAVASSSSVTEIQHRLGATGVLHHFSAMAGGNEVPRGKPDPAVYALAAQRLGIAPSACLALEDSENGALAALAAGAQVVMVPDLKAPSEALAARSLHLLPSLDAALPMLGTWFPETKPRG